MHEANCITPKSFQLGTCICKSRVNTFESRRDKRAAYSCRRVGLGTTVYIERKFKTKVKKRHVVKNPWRSPGSNLNEPSIFVDGDLDESKKRSASGRLHVGDLVPQVRARTSPGVFHDMALLGLSLVLNFLLNTFGSRPLTNNLNLEAWTFSMFCGQHTVY